MKKRLILILVFLVVFGAQDLFSQAGEDVLQKLNKTEEAVFTEQNAGHYSKALDKLFVGLADLIAAWSGARGDLRDELEARGECYVQMIYTLCSHTSRYQEAIKVLEETIPGGAPLLKSLSQSIIMKLSRHLNDMKKADELKKGLGYIDEWRLIGPFDNERGAGFDIASEPEAKVNFDEEYQGKERPVKWRENPCSSLMGYIDLDAMMNPNDQVLAYGASYIISDSDKDAALRFSCDEAFKVFFNGQLVLSQNARRLCHFDQNEIGLRLREGVNLLLVKICDQTGPWGFAARITSPSGAPISGVSFSNKVENYTPTEYAPTDVKITKGAVDFFLKRAENGDARANLYLGYLHLKREYKGEDAGLASKHLAAFLKTHPDHVYANYLKANSEKRRYDIIAEKDENQWRWGIEKTLSIDPKNVECHVLMASYYMSSLMAPNSALKHVQAALEINPGFLPAHYLLADIYDSKGMNVRAKKTIEKLGENPDNLKYVKLLIQLGDLAKRERKPQKAVEYWEKALKIDFLATGARRRLIDMAASGGDIKKAETLIDERLLLDPYNTYDLKLKSQLHLSDNDLSLPAEYLQKALEIMPEDDDALERLGNIRHMQGDDKETLRLFKEALRINPTSKDLRRYMEFLFVNERPYEDEYFVDPRVLLAAHEQSANPDNDSHKYLLLQDVIKVNKDGTSSHYHHMVVRILNDEGANIFDYFVRFYTPGEQKCRIKTAQVFHPNGTVEEAKIDNTPRRGESRFGGQAPGFVDLPPLKAGDVVDVEIKIDDLVQSFFGDYFGYKHFFQAPDLKGVIDARFSLILPQDREFYFNQLNFDIKPEIEVDEALGVEIRTWTLSNLQKVNREQNMPARIEYTPCVEVTTYKDWNQFGAWWWNLVQEQCDTDEDMINIVTELTKDLKTEEEKVRAIYNFVVSNIRYNDTWEFGVHGFKPYRASVIFRNRFGDCKDTAILMKTLLEQVGVKSYPVLINLDLPRSKEDLTLPLVSHFNHCILYVPTIDGEPGRFLDLTAQHHPMDTLPAADSGATVFVVYEDKGEIKTIPYPAPDAHFKHEEFMVTINEDKSAAISSTHKSGGMMGTMDRQGFLNPGKRKVQIEQRYSRVFGDLKVGEFSFSNLEDLNTKVEYKLNLSVDELLLENSDRYQLLSVFNPADLGSMAAMESRKFDILLGLPFTLTSIIHYKLPESLQFQALPEDKVLDNEFASFSLTYKMEENGTLRVSRVFVTKGLRVPAIEYQKFRDFCRDADRAEQRMIQVTKK